MKRIEASVRSAVASQTHPPHQRRHWDASFHKSAQVLGIGGFLVLLIIIFSLTADRFLTPNNWTAIASNVAVIGIVSIGQTFAIIAGGFDLSVAGVVPLASVIFAIAVNNGVPVLAATILTLILGLIVGVANGVIITFLKINPLICTLGTLSITGGLAFVIADGLTQPLADVSDGILAADTLGRVPNHVWIMLGLGLLAAFVLRNTIYGRAIYALGGNPEASWLAGMRVRAVTISVYALCSCLAALAGVIVASQLLAGSATLGTDTALTSIAAVILGGGSLIGGVGSILGTLTGVVILGTLSNGLALLHVSSFYQQIVTGAVLLFAVGLAQVRRKVIDE